MRLRSPGRPRRPDRWRRAPQPPEEPSNELVRRVEVAEILEDLQADDPAGGARVRSLSRLAAALASGARSAGGRAVLSGRSLADVVHQLAPQVHVRDLAALSEQHGGLTGDALCEALVATAARTTAGVGAAGGALAAAQRAAPAALVLAPVQLAAETVAVVLVELRLVAELHVASGHPAPGPPGLQAAAYVQAWAAQRGFDVGATGPGSAVVATAARQQLRARLVHRLGRGSAVTPLVAGAAAGAELNRRETRALGDAVRADLRAR